MAILVSSLVYFVAMSILFVMPSALCAIAGLKSNIKDKKKLRLSERIKVNYNEGCVAASALVAVITGIAVLFINPKPGWQLLFVTFFPAFITHMTCNFFINNNEQAYLRKFIFRFQCINRGKIKSDKTLKRWFVWEKLKSNLLIINIFYSLYSLCVAFLSVVPLYVLTGSKIYFTDGDLLTQFIIVIVLYFLLFIPALSMIFKNKSDRDRDIPRSLALAPAVLIVIFGVFSALLIQINQRGIELVGMSSWKSQVFAFNADQFPAYYFPENKWGETRRWNEGNIRLVNGVEVFSSGELMLVCPSTLIELRQKALESNSLIWKSDENSRQDFNELSQFCLIAKSAQVRTGAALKVLFESLPR